MGSLSSLIVCGSNSKKSKSIEVTELLSKELSVWSLFLNSSASTIPLISNELLDRGEFPPDIKFLVEKIEESQVVIFVFPQYNYNFSGFFKNVLDWCSVHTRKLLYSRRVILVGISNTKAWEKEFQLATSATCSSLGASEIIFENVTPDVRMPDLVNRLRRYV
ncbi:putative flavoprotein [Candidatus Mycoplasma haematolamae str. Purdue]|uniref:Putative flavoprotein n=1 Tax=Mycoplasma haematolamae (strain Purdue) TaxID=1212765 RepID=I7BIP5_MYCHA|nr:NAD(P)H-dependent oxidoreductase [Candidatus Mycoplasma haematolamae]AFO51693.1 putative flavoprotein [Candidatus Mycoplasma haematolamae str. Purdue]